MVECKADVRKHESSDRSKPAEYAVDGVLHYSRHLASYYDVIALAVSGTTNDQLQVSTFRQLKGSPQPELLQSPHGTPTSLIPVRDYIDLLTFDPAVKARTEAELIAFSRDLHNYMRDYAKLSESEKPLVVSGILLALRDDAFFSRTWSRLKARHLATELYAAIERVAIDADIPEKEASDYARAIPVCEDTPGTYPPE